MNRPQWAVQVSGTCGELAQGFYQGEYGIVTAPIDRFTTAVARLYETGEDIEPPGWQVPVRYLKVAAALLIARERAYMAGAGAVLLHSPLPRGKGFGSSTADIVAALAAASLAEGRPLNPADMGRLAAAVEPSDGTMFKGACHFASRSGHLIRALPSPPSMAAGVLDWGGKVDTCRFHRNCPPADSGRQAGAFRAVISGLVSGNPWDIGWGATQSALTHQAILPKPGLERLTNWVQAAGGFGVCVAHSGTIAGVLFAPDACWTEIQRCCGRLLPHVGWRGVVSFNGNGVRWAATADRISRVKDVTSVWQPWPTPKM